MGVVNFFRFVVPNVRREICTYWCVLLACFFCRVWLPITDWERIFLGYSLAISLPPCMTHFGMSWVLSDYWLSAFRGSKATISFTPHRRCRTSSSASFVANVHVWSAWYPSSSVEVFALIRISDISRFHPESVSEAERSRNIPSLLNEEMGEEGSRGHEFFILFTWGAQTRTDA